MGQENKYDWKSSIIVKQLKYCWSWKGGKGDSVLPFASLSQIFIRNRILNM